MATVIEWFQSVNAPFTFMLVACVLYWLMVITGFLGLDFFDFDVDLDADLKGDFGDVGSVGMFSGFLRFFHFHEVPFMVVMTLFSFILWIFATLLNQHWNPDKSWTLVAIGILPTILGALAITKIAIQPFAYLFRRAVVPQKNLAQYAGDECIVTTSSVTNKFGQAEIQTGESPLVVQVRNPSAFRFHKGDLVRLETYVPEGCYFEIRPASKAETGN
jgi:hypothetical protein